MMARLARAVVPGCPHHVTQQGNHRQDVFFSADDRQLYLRILQDHCVRQRVRVLACCLTNQVQSHAQACHMRGQWKEVLESGYPQAALMERLREATRAGRPFGEAEFVDGLEQRLGRALRAQKHGPKRKTAVAVGQTSLVVA